MDPGSVNKLIWGVSALSILMPSVHYSNNFTITVQIQWICPFVQIPTKWLLQNFAHHKTNVLSWHMLNFALRYITCITHSIIGWDILKRPFIKHSKLTHIVQVYKASTISMLWFMDHPALISGISRQNMAIFVDHMCGNMAAASQKLGRLLCQLNTTNDSLHLKKGILYWIFL